MEGKTYWDTEREQEYQPINNAHPLKLFARNRFPVPGVDTRHSASSLDSSKSFASQCIEQIEKWHVQGGK
jgi:hypothetical protein